MTDRDNIPLNDLSLIPDIMVSTHSHHITTMNHSITIFEDERIHNYKRRYLYNYTFVVIYAKMRTFPAVVIWYKIYNKI